MRKTTVATLLVASGLCSVSTSHATGPPYSLLHSLPYPDFQVVRNIWGVTLAASEDYLAIGSHGVSRYAPESDDLGQAYAYDVLSGERSQRIQGPPLTAGDFFTRKVAIDGDLVVVGGDSERRDVNEPVHVYDAANGRLVSTIGRPDGINHYFASEIAISNGLVLVESEGGSTLSGERTTQAVFLFDALTGDLMHTFESPSMSPSFGQHIAMDDDHIALGTIRDESGTLGAIHIYDVASQLIQHSFSDELLLGLDSVAVKGDRVLVGAYGGRSREGHLHMYDFSGTLLKTYGDPDSQPDFLGASVAFSGDNILATSTRGSSGGVAVESKVYLFDANTGGVIQEFTELLPSSMIFAGAHTSSPDGEYIAISARPRSSNTVSPSKIFVFQRTIPEPSSMTLLLLLVISTRFSRMLRA